MPIRTKGTKPPLFVVHGEPLKIAFRIRADRPVYGVSLLYHPELERMGESMPLTVGEYAQLYLDEIRAVQPKGPYYLCGYSAGGTIAFEMARLIIAQGDTIGNLLLVEPTVTELDFSYSAADKLSGALNYLAQSRNKAGTVAFLRKLAWAQKQRLVKLYNKSLTRVFLLLKIPLPENQRWTYFIKYLRPVVHSYVYPVIDCRATLVYSLMYESTRGVWSDFWAQKLLQNVDIVMVDSAVTHLQLMEDPALSRTTELIDRVVEADSDSPRHTG